MPASTGLNAFGTLLKLSGTTIAEVTHIGGPTLSRDTIEVTHMQSPNMWREFIKGLKDGGEVSFDIQYVPSNSTHGPSAGLLADFANDTTISVYTLVFPDSGATTWTFSAIVTAFEPDMPFDDKISASVTLKISGQPTLA